jgi:nucleoside-diphosphate-sugar epimerase
MANTDVEAIAHVASPVTWSAKDPFEDVINPAVKGTLNLLKSAHKYGKKVKHIVVTSSVASVFKSGVAPDYVYTEADWNDEAIKDIQKQKDSGEPFDGTLAYRASKNEAERAVWRFKEEHNPSFTLTTILPSYVFGPIRPPPETIKAVEATSTPIFVIKYYLGENKDPTVSVGSSSFVSVIDVAIAHVLAIQHADKADGQRYITSQGAYSNQQTVDVLRREYPDRKDIIAKGEPGNYRLPSVKVDGSKITRELGLQYDDFETVLLQTIESVKHLYN